MSASEQTSKFGRYHILERLATGGMAQIFKAVTANQRVFTLKKILADYSDNADFIRMFLDEAKISLNLKHANIVRVLDFGQLEGTYYLAMEFVFGKDLGSVLRFCAERRIYIPIDVACQIILQCCRGLEYAHSLTDSFGKPLGIIHRDISPPNILVGYNGEGKILDFGIAKARKASGKVQTRSGVLKGKFCYMSPEQASGQPLTNQSDLFSLAIVFYELLTSKSLFYSDDEIETLERVRKAQIKPPSSVRKEIPGALDRILLKALAAKPKKRYASCAEFGEDIRRFLKNHYPRTDTRSVARFIRACFADDFQTRSKSAAQEGWKDVLLIGDSDDELLLDRSYSELDELSTKNAEKHISLISRIFYDPKLAQGMRRLGKRAFFLLAVLGVTAYGWKAGWWRKGIDSLLNPQPPTVSETGTLREETPHRPPPVGGYAYWVETAMKAEEQGKFEQAFEAYERALSINAFDLNIQVRRAFAGIAIGKIREFCRWFEMHKEIAAADKLLASARCDEAIGQDLRAIRSFSEFVKKYPKDSRVPEVQRVIERMSRSRPK